MSKSVNMYSYEFRRALRYGAALKLDMKVGAGPRGLRAYFRNNPTQGSKIIEGSAGLKLLRNALWPPNLVGRTTDRSVVQ